MSEHVEHYVVLRDLHQSLEGSLEFPNLLLTKRLSHLGTFGDHVHRVRQVIGMAGSVLFFLDTDLWIFSLDISNSSTILAGAKRHFFLLS